MDSIKKLDVNNFLKFSIFLFLLIAVKFFIIYAYGNPTPYWDQWDAEAAFIYPKWINGSLGFLDLISLHNEHRILTTRLLALLIFELNGEIWNPLIQMFVNAIIHSLALTLLLYLLGKDLNKKQQVYFLLFSLIILSIPFGWENTLAGFQAQFYFLLLFTFLFLWGLSNYEVGSIKWWISLFFGILCPLSLASGAISLFAGGLVLIIKKREYKSSGFFNILEIISPFILAFIFIYLTPVLNQHATLKAQSLQQFISSFLIITAWPYNNRLFGPLLVQLPLLIFSYLFFKNSNYKKSDNIFIFAIILWFFGQIISISYGRSIGSTSSRYLDLFSIGIILNFFIVLRFYQAGLESMRKRIIVFAILWVILVFYGFISTFKDLLPQLELKAKQSIVQENNVRSYLCTGNYKFLKNANYLEIPYPNPERLRGLLDDPAIRKFLPKSLFDSKDTLTKNSNFSCKNIPLIKLDLQRWDGISGGSDFVSSKSIILNQANGRDFFNSNLSRFNVFGTYKNSDHDVGSITFQAVKGQKILYRSGPVAENQMLLITLNESPTTNLLINLPVSTDWAILDFNDEKFPERFNATLLDLGGQWGEWSAIGLSK